jgi:hypothetical protein
MTLCKHCSTINKTKQEQSLETTQEKFGPNPTGTKANFKSQESIFSKNTNHESTATTNKFYKILF